MGRNGGEYNTYISFIYKIEALQILFYKRIKYITLKPIFNSKAFINNNYRVIENIFLDQLQYNRETAFNDWLFLVYGD